MSENNTSNDAANGTNNKNATGTMFTRFADYFVICGLDLESGLEPQWNKNIGKKEKRRNIPEPRGLFLLTAPSQNNNK